MAKITKDMSLGSVINKFPKTIEVFSKYGLHCVGCQAAYWETIEQGAKMHGIPVDKLVKDLNKAIETKKRTIKKKARR